MDCSRNRHFKRGLLGTPFQEKFRPSLFRIENGVGSGLGFAWAFAPHYHLDRLGDSLPCSEWVRVLAPSYGRQPQARGRKRLDKASRVTFSISSLTNRIFRYLSFSKQQAPSKSSEIAPGHPQRSTKQEPRRLSRWGPGFQFRPPGLECWSGPAEMTWKLGSLRSDWCSEDQLRTRQCSFHCPSHLRL